MLLLPVENYESKREKTVMQDYDYSFSQNGLVAYKAGELIGTKVCITLHRVFVSVSVSSVCISCVCFSTKFTKVSLVIRPRLDS